MTAVEALRDRMKSGTPPALAIHQTAREYGQTASQLCKKLADFRRTRATESKRVTMCVDCGVLPASHNGLCHRCESCTASAEG
jgi:hypothetical protein